MNLNLYLAQWGDNAEHLRCRHENATSPIAADRINGPLLTHDDLLLIAEVWVANEAFDCEWCGGITAESMNPPVVHPGWCWSCHFWHERTMTHLAHPDRSFIIDGRAYMAGEEKPGERPMFRGFGGATFIIKHLFRHEKPLVSRNLWCQGNVPPSFRNLLSDNAAFIKEPQA